MTRPADDMPTGAPTTQLSGGPDRGHVSSDFVFGTLATDELRLAQLRAETAAVHHGHDLDPPDPLPGEPVQVRVRLGGGVDGDHVTCHYTTDGTDPAGDRGRPTRGAVVGFRRTAVEWDTLSWSYLETWSAVIPGQPSGTLVRYRIQAWSEHRPGGAWATETAGVVGGERPAGVAVSEAIELGVGAPPLWPVPRTGSFAFHVDAEAVPDWLRDAVIYQVFIDRFATTGGVPFATPESPSGLYGGTLRGVVERLDHIVSTGATCLWLSPLFPSPSHHGYDATDYRSVEPRLGTDADLRDLVAAAHDAGMRVILDIAVNHVSSDHPAFQRALVDRTSPEAQWFTFTDWPEQYLSFFGVPDHPQIDADDPDARDHMIDSARQWLDLGVDGFRCDYANGPSHAFWSVFRAATREVRADSVTIGEVVETPALQRTYRGRLDACLDFTLLQALRGFFAFGDLIPSEFDAFLRRHLAFFDDFVLPSFLDNHDMNRFLWVARGDVRRLRLAALCQFTLPGPPIVYYGTEVGLSQDRDVRAADGTGHPEESRLPMLWGSAQDAGLLAFYRALGALRASDPSLWRGARATVLLDDATGLYGYRCTTGGRDAFVALNRGLAPRTVSVDSPGAWRLALGTDEAIALEGRFLTLPPLGGAVLLARPDPSGPRDRTGPE